MVKFKCSVCGLILTKEKVVRHTSLEDIDRKFILVKIVPCSVCLDRKLKQGMVIGSKKKK